MKVIVLAAGYATRLYPLTKDRAKPLLPVAGRPMIEHVLQHVLPIGGIDRVYVVTNARFAEQFQVWADGYLAAHSPGKLAFTIVNDGSTDDTNKLGAIGDIHYVLRSQKVDDDLIVVAGDNLFSQSLETFGRMAREKRTPLLALYDVGNLEEIKKYNAISLGKDGRITSFEEKPQEPKSTLTGIALYHYPRHVLPYIRQYIAEGHNPDQPGRLVQWLYPKMPFLTWRVPGIWFDIGSKESLEEANRVFSNLPGAPASNPPAK
jgi:glucose-1-phosphate thymidylyltransferase